MPIFHLLLSIFFELLFYVIRLYVWAIIIAAIMSMLLSFNVLDRRNRAVWMISDFLYRITEPALRPIRQLLPDLGGIDLSPWIAVVLLQMVVLRLLEGIYFGLQTGVWQPL